MVGPRWAIMFQCLETNISFTAASKSLPIIQLYRKISFFDLNILSKRARAANAGYPHLLLLAASCLDRIHSLTVSFWPGHRFMVKGSVFIAEKVNSGRHNAIDKSTGWRPDLKKALKGPS